ncbi:hypothetical protein [Sphingobacterium sp. MYb388]|jgi:hypothetical protein|uniref:hypothetical protein n=2 Tax=Sphingobacterium TaxID=28453 RepID=UPI0030B24511
MKKQEQDYIALLVKAVKTNPPRKYKDGFEIRSSDPDRLRNEVQHHIKVNQWPIEIFDVNAQLRSVSVRLKKVNHEADLDI